MLTLLCTVAACAGPTQRFDAAAQEHGLHASDIQGAPFQHRIYANPGATSGSEVLHVYLSGDGSPWLVGHRIAPDPTPRLPVMPALMALDPDPSVLLGRPCYHGHYADSGCNAWLWTQGRYSLAVVDSMAAAISRLMAAGGHHRVVLIGHSGGGSLAMLLAARLPETRAVVTLAANLDVSAWVTHHDYLPLTGSLDPATQPPLPRQVAQMHLLASDDTVVPPDTQIERLKSLSTCEAKPPSREQPCSPSPIVRILDGADHGCCWVNEWPQVLGWLREQQ